MKIISFIILVAVFQVSCNSFENRFYNAIDKGENQAIKTHNRTTFDLSSITDFEWDSVLVVRGNESVPVAAEEIERDLHRSTIDLPVFKDRFYFLQHDKKIIVEEIESSIESARPDYDMSYA